MEPRSDSRPRHRRAGWALLAFAGLFSIRSLDAQAPAGRGPAPTPKAAAPIDLTGYWVSVITEEWRYRMVTPGPGDYLLIPMTLEAKAVADAWDPAKDEAAGNQCRSYGAAGVMRLPERLHVTWQDDTTLRMDIDAGAQTRIFHFGDWKASNGDPSWQGDSLAQWERTRSLKVTTTHLRGGYLRKNGVPYSENANLTEHFDVVREPNGETWMIVTTTVRDPRYLRIPYITAAQFKKEPDGSRWDPAPCSARW
jgi:hypothetical protein